MEWHLMREGEKLGPFTVEQVAELVQQGQIKPNDLVWHSGLSNWIKAVDAIGLFFPPPLPVHTQEKLPPLFASTEGSLLYPTQSQHFQHVNPPRWSPGSGNWFDRHWRGELSLGISYWINQFIVLVGTFGTQFLLSLAVSRISSPYSIAVFWVGFWVAAGFLDIWLWVGIWRSANRHAEKSGRMFWATVAKVMVIIGFLGSISRFLTENDGWPAIVESFHRASEIKDLGYEIRLLGDGSEIEIEGSFGIGITEAVRKTLSENPNTQTIHLNSSGGLMEEARELRELIKSNELNTYTSSHCESACTIAFMGGKERFLKEGARLGFHQPSWVGLDEQDTVLMTKLEEDYLLSIGIREDFARKAYTTPPLEMWYPAPFELLDARVITGVVSGNEFGLSGIKEWKDQKQIESDLLLMPVYQALKVYEPDAFMKVKSAFADAVSRGESITDLRERTIPIIQEIALRRLPFASDDALMSLLQVMVQEYDALSEVSPMLVYDYAIGQERHIPEHLSKELVAAELDALAQVIQTASESISIPSASEAEHLLEPVISRLYQKFGDDIAMLEYMDNPSLIANRDKARIGEMLTAYYKIIIQLPRTEAIQVLRCTLAPSDDSSASATVATRTVGKPSTTPTVSSRSASNVVRKAIRTPTVSSPKKAKGISPTVSHSTKPRPKSIKTNRQHPITPSSTPSKRSPKVK